MNNPHSDCWFGEPCSIGLRQECPKAIAEAKRDKGAPWSALELRGEPGGLRHYLNGQPIHCGTGLELQAITYQHDDYGEYTVALQRGEHVRYEAQWLGEGGLAATLHADVAGHEFRARLEPWMRFRWPERSGDRR